MPVYSYPTEVAVPFHFDSAGRVAQITNRDDSLKSHVRAAALTALGERVMLPRYGNVARDSLFEPNTSNLAGNIRLSLQECLTTYVPEVKILEIAVVPSSDPATVTLKITFAYNTETDVQTSSVTVSSSSGRTA